MTRPGTNKISRVAVSRIDFYFDEWLSGTFRLSAEQRGVFITLCALFWSHEGQLPDDDQMVAGLCRVSTRKWRAIKNDLIEIGKIEIIDGFIYQERAEIELIKAISGKVKNSQKASKGGRKKAENRRKLLERHNTGSSPATKQEQAEAVPQELASRAHAPSPSLPPYIPPGGKPRNNFDPNLQRHTRLRSYIETEMWMPDWGEKPDSLEAAQAEIDGILEIPEFLKRSEQTA